MSRSFLYLAVQNNRRFGLDIFDVRVSSAAFFNTSTAYDINQDLVDLDRSILFDVGTEEIAQKIKTRLHTEFFMFNWGELPEGPRPLQIRQGKP